MLGIHVSEGTAEGWFGRGKKSAIVSIAILVVLIVGVAFGIIAAVYFWTGTSVSQPNAPVAPAPAPAPAAPKPIAPTPEPTHIIPEPTPPPAPKPVAREYIYNPVEYRIAVIGSTYKDGHADILAAQLGLSEKEVIAFQKEHKINPGDTVIISGKVNKKSFLGVELGEVIGYRVLGSPKKDSNWLATVKVGEKITLRGKASSSGEIDDCELVK